MCEGFAPSAVECFDFLSTAEPRGGQDLSAIAELGSIFVSRARGSQLHMQRRALRGASAICGLREVEVPLPAMRRRR